MMHDYHGVMTIDLSLVAHFDECAQCMAEIDEIRCKKNRSSLVVWRAHICSQILVSGILQRT